MQGADVSYGMCSDEQHTLTSLAVTTLVVRYYHEVEAKLVTPKGIPLTTLLPFSSSTNTPKRVSSGKWF